MNLNLKEKKVILSISITFHNERAAEGEGRTEAGWSMRKGGKRECEGRGREGREWEGCRKGSGREGREWEGR